MQHDGLRPTQKSMEITGDWIGVDGPPREGKKKKNWATLSTKLWTICVGKKKKTTFGPSNIGRGTSHAVPGYETAFGLQTDGLAFLALRSIERCWLFAVAGTVFQPF